MWLALTSHWLHRALKKLLQHFKLRVKSFFLYSFISSVGFIAEASFARPPPVLVS